MTQSLWIDRLYSPFWVLIRTFLTKPSLLGKMLVISAISHCIRLRFGLSSRTKSPILTFSLVWNHLFHSYSVGAKYFIQHIQNSPTLFWTLLSRCLGLTLTSSSGWEGELCCPNRRSLDVMVVHSRCPWNLGRGVCC